MSIADKLTKIETDLTASYDAVEEQGGTVPAKKNTENLAPAILSILKGGGGVTAYTVTFDSNGGSEVASQQIVSGNLVVEPREPIKDGFIFNYWALNGVRYDFTTLVTQDITLVAVWEQSIEYTEVEYLESTGTQYIDTEICPYKTKTEVTFQYTGAKIFSGAGYVVASWTTDNNRYYPASYSGTVLNVTYNAFRTANKENVYTKLGDYDNNVHTVIYNDENNKVYFDGVSKATVSDLTTSNTNSIYLFAMHGSNGAADLLSCRIMSVKFTDKETGELVGDFIPVLDKDNIACYYNKVTNKYHYNKGTGSFTAGLIK